VRDKEEVKMVLTGKLILCVEDDPDTCEMIKLMLAPIGCEVETAGTVKESLLKVSVREFDLFILDTTLADGNGLELCSELRRLHPGTPIIIFSGRSSSDDRDRGFAAGASAYLVKPGGIGELPSTVARLLGASERTVGS
jgi:DNA-binding response OmpR family regulator